MPSILGRRAALQFIGLCAIPAAWGCNRHSPSASEASEGPSSSAASPGAVSGVASASAPATIRCAVIGGMMTTGLFPAIAERFEKATGTHVEIVISGNKRMIAPSMEKGDVDLITMHASDIMMNLVADGFALDAVPWARNDHVIVGPTEDPAHVRGLTDAAEAMRRIVAAKAPFVEHRAPGSGEVLRAVLDDAHVALTDAQTSRLGDGDNQEAVLELASKKRAYTLVGRIPVELKKLQGDKLDILVEGDPKLYKPYLVAIANPKRWPRANVVGAKALQSFLVAPATQAFLTEFAREKFHGRAPFAPITTP